MIVVNLVAFLLIFIVALSADVINDYDTTVWKGQCYVDKITITDRKFSFKGTCEDPENTNISFNSKINKMAYLNSLRAGEPFLCEKLTRAYGGYKYICGKQEQ